MKKILQYLHGGGSSCVKIWCTFANLGRLLPVCLASMLAFCEVNNFICCSSVSTTIKVHFRFYSVVNTVTENTVGHGKRKLLQAFNFSWTKSFILFGSPWVWSIIKFFSSRKAFNLFVKVWLIKYFQIHRSFNLVLYNIKTNGMEGIVNHMCQYVNLVQGVNIGIKDVCTFIRWHCLLNTCSCLMTNKKNWRQNPLYGFRLNKIGVQGRGHR